MPPAGSFDFIVVGSGPAGTMAALRLAKSKASPSVLLLEAGPRSNNVEDLIDAERFIHRMNPVHSWGYESAPQKHLDNRAVDISRGRVVGGSTVVNFSCWTFGPRDEFNELARLVRDKSWDWLHAQARFRQIECLCDKKLTPAQKAHLKLAPENHGQNGPIKTGFPTKWEKSTLLELNAFKSSGLRENLDLNSGQPIGVGISASSAVDGTRSTAADALVNSPSNLRIVVNSQVARVVFEGTKAVGVSTLDGRTFLAKREIVLSCGAYETPRVLMHSGIGPGPQLQKFKIRVVRANPHVGQHMQDHVASWFEFDRADHTSTRAAYYRSKEAQAAARKQWLKDRTGPLSEFGCSLVMGFLKSKKMFDSGEFNRLADVVKARLRKETVPAYEILSGLAMVDHLMDPTNAVTGGNVGIVLLNMQSEGSVTLKSADPKVPLVIDSNLLAHPYDRRLAIESTRETLKMTRHPAYAKDTKAVRKAPKSDSEKDILEYWAQTSGSAWHATSTARMALEEKAGVVDKDLKVFGIQRLRVADLSVLPFTPR